MMSNNENTGYKHFFIMIIAFGVQYLGYQLVHHHHQKKIGHLLEVLSLVIQFVNLAYMVFTKFKK
jgi:hypothetical protein